MKRQLGRMHWNLLMVDSNYDYVRAAFYLGYSFMYIKIRVSSKVYEAERAETVRTAKLLGMTDADVVTLNERICP